MSEPLFQLCPICRGEKKIPPDAQICDLPASLRASGDCICTLGKYPGFAKTGLTLRQVEAWRMARQARPLVYAMEAWTVAGTDDEEPQPTEMVDGAEFKGKWEALEWAWARLEEGYHVRMWTR